MKHERKVEIINSLKLCVDLEKEDMDEYFKNLQQIGKSVATDDKIPEFRAFFISLGNETRLQILKILSVKDYCVCELEAILNKPQPSISHHLRTLEKMGIIRGIKKGYFTHYELVRERLKSIIDSFKEDFSSNERV
jgi:DNA-binding transcriptional ArsR family regulator